MSVSRPAPSRASVQYDLEATHLRVDADEEALLGGIDSFLAPRRSVENRAPGFVLDIRVDVPPALPEGAQLLYSGEMPAEGECTYVRTADSFVLTFPGDATLTVRPQERRAQLVVAPHAEAKARGSLAAIALEFALDADGQSVVHAAGLSLPGDERMLLVHAPSGTGKTTTALAAAGSGFRLCADDAVALSGTADGMRAWGLPRQAKVHRRSAEMLPWLAPALGPKWNVEEEQSLSREALAGLIEFDDARRPIAGLVRLARSPDGTTRAKPLARHEALASLAADNVRVGAGGLIPIQGRRYAALASLVGAVPCHELMIARPQDAADALRSLLSCA
jgi:hypothetical protein